MRATLLFFLLPAISLLAQGTQPGMGSIPYPGGVTFRVWAPNASGVWVAGEFNNWSHSASPLVSEGASGNWSADVAGAQAGQAYRYVITPNDGQPAVTRRDPYSRLVSSYDYNNGNSLIYDPNAFQWTGGPFHAAALPGLVVYEMHIGTFTGTSSMAPGTFQSAIPRLNAISGLGFNAVEVMPVTEFSPLYSIGYGPTDQLAIENEAYGGPDNFKSFVEAAHALGLAVIVDIVDNHWGPWNLSTNQFDGWWNATYPGGIYFYDSTLWNSPFGPRPNYSNPTVARYILDQLNMFIAEYHIDGFRWDSVSNIYNTDNGTGTALPDGWSLLQQGTAAASQAVSGFINIAEDLTGNAQVTAPVAQGGAGFGSQWSSLASTMRAQLTQTNDSNVNMGALSYAFTLTFNASYLQRVVYTESHNEVTGGGQRLTVLIDSADPTSWLARKKSTLGSAVLFSLPGIPMIFQGQEFLEEAPLEPKVPLSWSFVSKYSGIRSMYGDLVRSRRNLGGHTAGLMGDSIAVYQVDNTNKLIAYSRYDSSAPSQADVVIANFTGQPRGNITVGFPANGVWITRFNSDSTKYGSDFTGVGSTYVNASGAAFSGMPASGSVTIGPYSVLILSRQ